ncbi:hypothetical protein V1525DRAFT_42130 [Lipomyces kononenkoae]|uniref:Uncharacterized protein n=1 Tax=Lipomyces kononenkoae TaxID=34357 RepID=A0ACC3SSR5_LIPKO
MVATAAVYPDGGLPSADSPDLVLVPAPPEERLECSRLHSVAFKGSLDIQTYIARKNHLSQQHLTRDGLTCWVLVERNKPPGQRTILSSCETYRKKGFLAYEGNVEDILTHGVGTVYSRPEFRGKGYAGRMMKELSQKLDTWQMENERRTRSVFSVLFSDIGKSFYTRYGWKPFPSFHISLPAITEEEYRQEIAGVNLPKPRTLLAEDVRTCMCNDNIIQQERELLRAASEKSSKAQVAIVPDFDHFLWHWAREEFYAERVLSNRDPPLVKGAGDDGARVHCVWSRNFGESLKDNTLYILHWVYDKQIVPSQTKATVKAMAAILRSAQLEAHRWNMAQVEFWSPTPLMLEAIGLLDPSAKVVDREDSSICSLKWNGAEQGLGNDVEWCLNEKYTWC